MTTERIITLRVRPATGLYVGMLIGSPKGRAVYRVLEITTLRRSGEIQSPRLRVVCRRLAGDEPTAGATVHPWPSDPRAPRRPRPAPPPRRPPAEMALVIATNRRADRFALEIRRLAWRGREGGYGTDVGPRLRHHAVVDADGQVIREADVTIDTARDVKQPGQRIRRAVRTDPLVRLEQAGSISGREFDAAEILRNLLEAMTPSQGQGEGGMPVHTPAFLRRPISGANIEASEEVREAAAALGKYWEAVLWVCLGGTVSGYSVYRTMRLETAGKMVRTGMEKLADHFEGERVLCAL